MRKPKSTLARRENLRQLSTELLQTRQEIAALRQQIELLSTALCTLTSSQGIPTTGATETQTSSPTESKPTKTAPPERNDFFALIQPYLDRYTQSDHRMLQASLRHLHRYWPATVLPLPQLTKPWCRDYLDYLYRVLRGNTPAEYFKKFRKLIHYLVDEGHLPADPTAGIRLPQSNEVTKAILSDAELTRLAATPASHPVVKRAFLFACYTGLRRCDLAHLTYRQIDFTARRLTLVQQKVRSHSSRSVLHLNLNATAMRLLDSVHEASPSHEDDLLFPLPSYTTVKKALQRWVRQSGIRKHITFHCARHTFITRLMAHGANIATTASLAGHSSTRHTEKYIHIVDELKQKAVDSLPPLGEIT
jgi:integrase